jgi:hypothetical protein
MSRGVCTFRQRDVTAAVKAVIAAGVPVERVEIDKDGKIVVVTSKAARLDLGNDFDRWKERHARSD